MPLEGPELADFLGSRAGRLTGSRMKDAMAMLKNGKPSETRSKLLRELLAERLTGQSIPHYVSPAMQWGLDWEEDGKAMYQAETGVILQKCRFTLHPTIENFGATSDSLIGHDGLFELKCPTTGTFIDWWSAGVVPDEYKPQMVTQIACYQRPWCEFVAYDPRIRDPKRRMFVRRFTPTAEEIAVVEKFATDFLNELDMMFDQFVSSPL